MENFQLAWQLLPDEAEERERAAGAEGPAADVAPYADPVICVVQQCADLWQQDGEDTTERAAGAEELHHGSSLGRAGSDMMARISVCPQRPPAGTLSSGAWMVRHGSLRRICAAV